MKCNLFELTYLPDDTRIWSNADEFLTLIQTNNQQRVDYELTQPFSTKQVGEDDFDMTGTLGTFCFTDSTKIYCLLFYEGVSFNIDDMNDPVKQAYFTMFHQYNLSWSADISMRSREIFNIDTLLKRLYSVVWADYTVNSSVMSWHMLAYDAPYITNDITYADLSAVDSAYDDIPTPRILVCDCHNNDIEIHHDLNVDSKKNWSLIESYVTGHLADSDNVSAWGSENTFILENDTSL